jgi:hypothetical protein
MADQIPAPAPVAPAGAPTAVPAQGGTVAPESAAARESALMSFFGVDDGAAQPAAQQTPAETEPAKPDSQPTPPVPESQPGKAAEPEPETTKPEPILPAEGEPEGEEEEAGERDDNELAETSEGIVYRLPTWAQELPAEAQTQIKEMGTGLVKQIHHLKEQRAAAREARDELKTEIESIRERANEAIKGPAPLERTKEEPLTEIRNVADLDRHLEEAQATLQWCKKNPKGGVLRDNKGGTVEWDEENVADVRENCERALEAGEARRTYLQTYAEQSAAARQYYPALFMPNSPWQKNALELLDKKKGVPELVKVPDYELLLGDMLVGRVVRNGLYKLVKVETGKGAAARPAAGGTKPAPKSALSSSATAPPAQPAGAGPGLSELRTRAAKGDAAAKEQLADAFFS